jgi:Fic family protein
LNGKTLSRIQTTVKQQKGWFTIGAISNQADVNWATARAYLLQLLAKGLIEGEELPIRGWIFRSKQPEIAAEAVA